MLFQRPLLLLKLPSLLMNHNNKSHPLIHQLNLAKSPISGIPSVIRNFKPSNNPYSIFLAKNHRSSCCWRRWEQWCASSGYNSIQAPISAINFLTCQFAEGKQYQIINSYCSVISMTHTPVDGVVVGKHPLVTRLIKGTLIVDLHSPDVHLLGMWEECLSTSVL